MTDTPTTDPLSMPDGRPRCPIHGMPDCSPMLNGCNLPNQIAAHDRARTEMPADLDEFIDEYSIQVDPEDPFGAVRIEDLVTWLPIHDRSVEQEPSEAEVLAAFHGFQGAVAKNPNASMHDRLRAALLAAQKVRQGND